MAEKITGHRVLTEVEISLINEIKEVGAQLGRLIDRLHAASNLTDPRWISIGRTDLQTGLMALTRSVARPTSF